MFACVAFSSPRAWRSVQSIVDDISTRDGLVVITGGEPMLYAHRPAFILLLGELKSAGRELHVESNGTIFPPEEVLSKLDVVVLSPKLSNAGSHQERTAAMATAWGDYQNAHEVHLKFVCVEHPPRCTVFALQTPLTFLDLLLPCFALACAFAFT